jgi:hypothetical protein
MGPAFRWQVTSTICQVPDNNSDLASPKGDWLRHRSEASLAEGLRLPPVCNVIELACFSRRTPTELTCGPYGPEQ